MQSVVRSPSGISTDSISAPSCVRRRPFTVPSRRALHEIPVERVAIPVGREAVAQRRGQIGPLRRVVDAAPVEPARDLLGAERLDALLRECARAAIRSSGLAGSGAARASQRTRPPVREEVQRSSLRAPFEFVRGRRAAFDFGEPARRARRRSRAAAQPPARRRCARRTGRRRSRRAAGRRTPAGRRSRRPAAPAPVAGGGGASSATDPRS